MTAITYPLSAFAALAGDIGRRALADDIATAFARPALRPGRRGARFIDDDKKPDPRFQFDFDSKDPLPAAKRAALDAIVAAHNPSARPEPLPADLPRGRPGSFYMRRAPKASETQANATGTMVYWDHAGNLLRVSDDFIFRSA